MQLNKNGFIDLFRKGKYTTVDVLFLSFPDLIFQVQGRFACPDRCEEIGSGTVGAPLVRGAGKPSGNNKDTETPFFK